MWFKKRPSNPDAQAAARRLVILKHLVVSALAAPPRELLGTIMSLPGDEKDGDLEKLAAEKNEQLWRPLRDAGLWAHLTPKEQEHSKSNMITMTERQQIDATWRMEAVQTLMWALGMLPAIPAYDTQADHGLLKRIPSQDLKAFIQSARLRAQPELEAARDNAEFWHWRSRTRQLIEEGQPFPDDPQMRAAGFSSFDDIVRVSAKQAAEAGDIPPCVEEDFPAKGKAYRDLTADEWAQVSSITMERHFTLNWLCGRAPDNNWDETPTET